jgi:hypothetical protein
MNPQLQTFVVLWVALTTLFRFTWYPLVHQFSGVRAAGAAPDRTDGVNPGVSDDV